MKDINEVLRKKEAELQQIEKDIEILRAAARLLAEDEPRTTAGNILASASTPPMVMRPASDFSNGGTKDGAGAWTSPSKQFP